MLTREQVEKIKTYGKWGDDIDALCDMALAWLEVQPRPISEAPKDGTQILAWETPNGEAHNLVMARFHTLYTHEVDVPPEQCPHWWGSGFRIGWNDWKGKGLYGRADNIAISPYAFIPLSALPVPGAQS